MNKNTFPKYLLKLDFGYFPLTKIAFYVLFALFTFCGSFSVARAITITGSYSGIVADSFPYAYNGATVTGSFGFGPLTTETESSSPGEADYFFSSSLIDLNFNSAAHPDLNQEFNFGGTGGGLSSIVLNQTSSGQRFYFNPIPGNSPPDVGANLVIHGPAGSLFSNLDLDTLSIGPSITSAVASYAFSGHGGPGTSVNVYITQLTVGSETITLPFNPPAVPLPASWIMMATAVIGLSGARLMVQQRSKLKTGA